MDLFSRIVHRAFYLFVIFIETRPESMQWILKKIHGLLSRVYPFRLIWLKQTIDPITSQDLHIKSIRIIVPAEKITLMAEKDREFLSICKYFQEGCFVRSEIYTYEVSHAFVHVGPGTICTPEFKVIADSGMGYRLNWLPMCDRITPLQAVHVPGICVNIYTLWSDNFWHFLYDCLAKVNSLIEVYPTCNLIILMPDSLTSQQRDLIDCVLPENYSVQYYPYGTWVKIDRLLVPSFVTRRANGFLPFSYYEFLRNSVFSHFGFTRAQQPTERIYLSRAGAKHRRVLNETEVSSFLEKFGFKTVLPESLSLRDQIDLFRKAEAIISPHGAALAATVFSNKIKALIMYPNDAPTSFFYTQLKGLGQEHYFLTGGKSSEENDFSVDIAKLENIVVNKMGLKP